MYSSGAHFPYLSKCGSPIPLPVPSLRGTVMLTLNNLSHVQDFSVCGMALDADKHTKFS